MKALYSSFIFACILASCQKKDTTIATPADVVISITSPAPAQIFRNGDTVHIAAAVSYPSELHGYELVISDSSSGDIYFDYAEHVHNDHFTIDQDWACSGSTAKTLQLKLTTEIDHDGNEADKIIYFKYQP